MKYIALAAALSCTSAFSAEYIAKLKQENLTLKSIKGAKHLRSFSTGVGQFAVLDLESKDIADQLSLDSNIEYIEPNYRYHSFNTTPRDKKFKKQWGLHNTGKNSGSWWSRGKEGIDINALDAWSVTKGSSEIKIAVIDTGVDYNHKDLKNNIMINEAELNGVEGVDDDGNGYIDDIYGYDFANMDSDPMDGHGHGTHCAGVIGAEHNRVGIAGVMENVKILPVKFLTDRGGGSLESALKAIDYATSRGVNVMSNSWGGGGRSQALFEAIERAEKAGIVFTAAAGNSRTNNDVKPTYPASYELDNIITVGALDGKGKPAIFTNYGKKTVHVFAPGVDIYSTVPNNRYKEMSGTSMACPHVSGVVGLLLANNPKLSYGEIKQTLMSTATESETLSDKTASGYIDAYKALKY